MLKKAHSLLLLSVALLLFVLSACGDADSDSNEDSNGGSNEGETSGVDGDKEAVTIDFMHLWPAGVSAGQNKIVNEIIEQFEAENPHVTVVQEVLENEQYKTKLQVVSSSNQLPDVGMTWAAGFLEPYVKGNLFAPLDGLLENGFGDTFVSGTLEAYAMDDQTYALPLELNIAPIYYNKAIFADHGLDVPETYDEFLNVVETLVDNGVAPIALGNRDRWTGSLWYMYLADRIGGSEALNTAIDRSGTFENPKLIEAASETQNLVNMDAFVRGFNGLSNEEAKAEFLNGSAAMYLMGSWELPNFTTNEEIPQEFRENVGFFKFPTIEGGDGNIDSWVGGPGVGLFVAENSDVKEEAMEFVKFFVEKWGEQSVTGAGVIPGTAVDTSTLDLPQLYIDVLNELANASNITLFADVQMSAGVAETHLNMIQSLFGNEVTPEEFAQTHEEALSLEE
ncbi:raffinose/stachyose/melibiose transport system substrate-binding protein [Evansella caseinilytica]|uniref:Raffinose/stachyose/melibiose transport system substrate-binding protein n=1 Tax=Evansella caseinilytica TaxID=1503961 RepID=A0A1H3U1F7_9BACI|nr:extracellular solute-binding protein [Evansella caseinilytica]SDZ56162.1 raffinose/stachyose/melibiose transport system substrate-binding protein [Evansella caseinilytica]